MALFRRRLRLWATAGLIWQAVSLSALVPRACCVNHQKPPQEKTTEAEPPCPLHGNQAAQPSPGQCSLRSACDGPLGVLSALLAHHGVLPDTSAVVAVHHVESLPVHAREALIPRRTPPDPPPPRA